MNMYIKKSPLIKLLFLFVLITHTFYLSAADGLLWGEKNIRVVKTQWFDIIYPPDSQKSAALLFENADRIYYEIAEFFGTEPKVRIPVVLTPNTEMYNAYYSSAYYNRIVLYDTSISSEVDVFSNPLLSTFRHELTHAYTFNLKSDYLLAFDRIFGDAANGSPVSITSGWAEGATMTSEASLGEGRLNNEYSRHMVKQAKLEGKFPSYADVQGASDVYPYGSFYYFNGAFDQWLQAKYGMEKYTRFWSRCINMESGTAGGAFKKVYGIKLKNAWKQFSEEYEVPVLSANPLLQEGLSFKPADFFSGSKSEYSALNVSGGVYKSLTASKEGIAFLEGKSSNVWYVKKSDFEKGNPKPYRLFSHRNIDSISLSEDGRYMAVSYTDTSKPNYQLKIKIYDLEKHRFITVDGGGLKEGIISSMNGEYYLVSQKFRSQDKWIDIKKIEGNTVTDYFTYPVKKGNPVFFTPAGNGRFAFIKNSALTYSVCLFDYSGQEKDIVEEYTDSSYGRLVMRDLFYDEESEKILFSWTEPGTMPRLGFLNLKTGLLELDKNDMSGGIFNPVVAGNRIVYAGHFFRQNRLFSIEIPNVESTQGTGNGTSIPKEEYVVLSDDPEIILKDSEAYKPQNYMKRGILLPASSAVSRSFNPDITSDGYSSYEKDVGLPFGVSYMTSNPWGSNVLLATAGYSPFTNSLGVEFDFSGGSDTNLLAWSLMTGCEFDLKGYKQALLGGQVSVTYPLWKFSSLRFSNQASFIEGKSNSVDVAEQRSQVLFNRGSEEDHTFMASDVTSVAFSTIHASGTGTFEYSGFSVKMDGSLLYHQNLEDTPEYADPLKEGFGANLSAALTVCIPKLIPVQCRDFYVYNLPATLGATIYPNNSIFMSGAAKVYLFGADFQKAVPGITCIFVNRLYLTAGYNCTVAYDKTSTGKGIQLQNTVTHMEKLFQGDYPVAQSVSLDFHMVLTPNVGTLANSSFGFDISVGLSYEFSPFPGKEPEFKPTVGVSGNF